MAVNEGRFPEYTLKMRGTQAIRIIQEGYTEAVFDREGLWAEYRKTFIPNDPNRRYVIERAIENLEGKSPRMYQRSREEAKIAGGWVDRWGALPARQVVTAPKRQKKRSPVLRILYRLLGL